ncbi:GntR family transcriptional regulator [Streptomyces griseoviridis]|uniref:GntR family transcriptional regulator n=1 Tax=Streptomyces griseoviridis TaxID=45398 RepID=UPI00344D4B4E
MSTQPDPQPETENAGPEGRQPDSPGTPRPGKWEEHLAGISSPQGGPYLAYLAEIKPQLIRAYEARGSLRGIADRTGLHESVVREIMRQAGVLRSKDPARDSVIARVRTLVGEYPINSLLPTFNCIADKIGESPASVYFAFRTLAAERMLRSYAGYGTVRIDPDAPPSKSAPLRVTLADGTEQTWPPSGHTYRAVEAELRKRIADGTYGGGKRLSAAEVSTEFAVSSGIGRKVLRVLRKEGLLHLRQPWAHFVRDDIQRSLKDEETPQVEFKGGVV